MIDLPDEARGGQRQPAPAHARRCRLRSDGFHARRYGVVYRADVARRLTQELELEDLRTFALSAVGFTTPIVIGLDAGPFGVR